MQLIRKISDREPNQRTVKTIRRQTVSKNKNQVRNYFAFLTLLLIVIFLSSCKTAEPKNTSTSTASPTATPTKTLTPTFTQTFTVTPSPTVTNTPTITPTLNLPVIDGTPLPNPEATLSAENVTDIVELARYGTPNVYQVLISPDGSRIIRAKSTGIEVLDQQSGDIVVNIPFTGYIRYINFNPITTSASADVVAVHDDHTVRIWQEGELVWEQSFGEKKQLVSYSKHMQISLSPDGSQIAIHYYEPVSAAKANYTHVTSYHDINGIVQYEINHMDIIDWQTGEVVKRFYHKDKAEFSPDGQTVMFPQTTRASFFDTTTWEEIAQISLPSRYSEVVFSSQSDIVAIIDSGHGEGVTIQQISNQEEIAFFDFQGYIYYHPKGILPELDFSPNGQFLAVKVWTHGNDSQVNVYNIKRGMLVDEVKNLSQNLYYPFVVNNDGQINVRNTESVSSNGASIDSRLIDKQEARWIHNGQTWEIKICHSEQESSCQNPTDVNYVTNGSENIYVGSKETNGHFILRSGTHPNAQIVADLALGELLGDIKNYYLSPSENILVYESFVSAVHIIHLKTGETHHIEQSVLKDVSFSKDGERVVLTLLNIKEDEERLNYLMFFDFTADNSVIYKSELDNLKYMSNAVISPNGSKVAYCYRSLINEYGRIRWNGIRLVNTSNNQVLAEQGNASNYLYMRPVAFSPDGKLLVAIQRNEVLLLEADTLKILFRWIAHNDRVKDVRFDRSGTHLISSSDDGFVKVWGLDSRILTTTTSLEDNDTGEYPNLELSSTPTPSIAPSIASTPTLEPKATSTEVSLPLQPLFDNVQKASPIHEPDLSIFAKQGWEYNKVALDNGYISIEGSGSWDASFDYPVFDIVANTGVLTKFKIDNQFGGIIALTRGEWNTDNYRQWGVFQRGDNMLSPIISKGTNHSAEAELNKEILVYKNTWYYLFLGIDEDNNLIQLLWSPAILSNYQLGFYNYGEVDVEPYYFHVVGNTGKITIEEVVFYQFEGLENAP